MLVQFFHYELDERVDVDASEISQLLGRDERRRVHQLAQGRA